MMCKLLCVRKMAGGKRAADNEPCPGNLLLYVDTLHILPVCSAGCGKARRVAVVHSDNLSWMLKFKHEQLFSSELEIDRRLVDVAQRVCLIDLPVALRVNRTRQQSARLYI